MRTRVMLIAFVLALHAISVTAQNNPWLHIYHIGIGHGDCTLITARDNLTSTGALTSIAVVIDTGPTGKTNMPTLVEAIRQYMLMDNVSEISYLIASHIHRDHVYGVPFFLDEVRGTGGIGRNIMVIDRYMYQAAPINVPDHCWPDAGRPYITRYQAAIGPVAPAPVLPPALPARRLMTVGEELFAFQHIHMRLVAGNGWALARPAATDILLPGYGATVPTGTPDENSLSLAWMIQFGNFRYFTAGDLTGSPGHWPMENMVATYMTRRDGFPSGSERGHLCCFKLDHHGSVTGTCPDFVSYFKPGFGVVPAALHKFGSSTTPLPDCSVLSTLRAPALDCLLYYTFVPVAATAPGFVSPRTDPDYCAGSSSNVAKYRDIIVQVGQRTDRNPGANPRPMTDITYSGTVQVEFGYLNREKGTLLPETTYPVFEVTPRTCPRTH